MPLNYTTPDNYAKSFDVGFTPTASPLSQQKSDYGTFNDSFSTFLNGQASVPQLQEKYANRNNIPFLQGQADQQNGITQMIGNQISALPGSVNSATSNSLLTQGQKDRIVQSQGAPLQQQFAVASQASGNTNSALNTAQMNQNTAVGQEQAQQLKETQPWLQSYDAMTIANAAQNAQWSQANQMELSRLLANQSTGATLSNAEQGRLEQLAVQEGSFKNALDRISQTADQERKTAFDANAMYVQGWGKPRQ